jgi:hypothetical protein
MFDFNVLHVSVKYLEEDNRKYNFGNPGHDSKGVPAENK